jgi:hypothetical protein
MPNAAAVPSLAASLPADDSAQGGCKPKCVDKECGLTLDGVMGNDDALLRVNFSNRAAKILKSVPGGSGAGDGIMSVLFLTR